MSTLRTQTAVIGAAFVAFAIANASALAQQKHLTPEQLMERLKTAAPPAIFEGATVVDMKEDGSMAVLRKGANGWSCMDPDGTAPMCVDANAMEWLHALMSKGPAPQSSDSSTCSAATTAPATPTLMRQRRRPTTIGSRQVLT
jgi:hypothetical protein